MRKTTFFKTMLLAVVMLAGSMNASAQTESVTYTFSEKGFANATVITSGSIDANLNYLAEKNDASTSPTYYTSGTSFRMYNNNTSTGNGCSYTISALNGVKITSLEIYGITGYLPPVLFNVDGGTDQAATLSSTIYTISGIEASTTLKFRNAFVGTTSSQLRITGFKVTYTTGTTTPTAATPTFSPVEGTYTTPQSVEITTTTPSASIYYTTNGSDPDNIGNGTLYTIPVVVNATTTLKARAYATGFDPSAIASAVYTFSAAPTITVTEVTIPALSAQIGNSDTEIINVNGANLTADIILTIDGANADMFSVNSPLPSSGGIATITYTPTANGLHTATLRLNSAGAAEETRTLNGSSILPAVSGNVIITEVYGGGGNSGAILKNDFVELYNTTAEQVEVGGWSIQYYSTTGTGTSGNITVIPEGKYIPSGAHFLIKLASGGSVGGDLSMPDAAGTINLSGSSGKVILYNTSGAQSITDLASITGNANFVDYVPYGQTAVPVWGTAMSSNASNTTSATRNTISPAPIGGQRVVAAVNYMYTGDINNDFSVVAPSPTSTGLNTGFNTAKLDANVYVLNGKVVFQAAADQTVEIFNAVGQRIVSKNAVDGLNTIPVTQKGLLIVKVGNKVSKVIL